MRRVVLVALAIALAGAAMAQPASGNTTPERVLDWQLVNGQVAPALRVVAVWQGERLRWRIASDTAGELHLHAYRLRVPVQPGQTAELAFTAHATGHFRVEWHSDAGQGVLPVAHRAPALAVLEVRPR